MQITFKKNLMPPLLRRFLATGLLLLPATLVAAPAIICSFSIPADWAARVGGAEAAVTSLTPRGSDFHAVQPTPAQVRAVSRADLVVGIHPALEPWLAAIEKNGDLPRPVLWLAKDDPALRGGCPHHDHAGHDHEEEAAQTDPHVWMDPDIAATLVEKLAAALSRSDPAAGPRGAAYAAELRALTVEIRTRLASVPPERRRLVTRHGNMRRFADKFGFTVAATLLPGGAGEGAEPSARQLAATLALIRREKIPVVFADNTLSPRVPERIAREAGLPPPVTLAVDSLGAPGSPSATYAGMMRDNARLIAEALAPAAGR